MGVEDTHGQAFSSGCSVSDAGWMRRAVQYAQAVQCAEVVFGAEAVQYVQAVYYAEAVFCAEAVLCTEAAESVEAVAGRSAWRARSAASRRSGAAARVSAVSLSVKPCGGGEGADDGPDVHRYVPSGGDPLVCEVGEHTGEFGVGTGGETGDPVQWDLVEDALQYGLPVLGVRKTGGAVRAEGGLDETAVVAAQGFADERQGEVAEGSAGGVAALRVGEEVQGPQDGPLFGRVAVAEEARQFVGERLPAERQRGEQNGTGRLVDGQVCGQPGAAAASSGGGEQGPDRGGPVGDAGHGLVEPGAGRRVQRVVGEEGSGVCGFGRLGERYSG